MGESAATPLFYLFQHQLLVCTEELCLSFNSDTTWLTNEIHNISLYRQSFFTCISHSVSMHPLRLASQVLLSPVATTGMKGPKRTNPRHWKQMTSLVGCLSTDMWVSWIQKWHHRTTISRVRTRCYLPRGADLYFLRPVATCSLWPWIRTNEMTSIGPKGWPWPQRETSWLICSPKETKWSTVVLREALHTLAAQSRSVESSREGELL